MFVVGLIAGVLVVAAALGRLGRYLAYIPWPVVEGFTVGIALIIFLQQVPAALGVAKAGGREHGRGRRPSGARLVLRRAGCRPSRSCCSWSA